MFFHIGLQTTTAEISSYTISQSYWKMYHLQSEHEYGTCMMGPRHILKVLWQMFWTTPIVTDGYVKEEPLHGLHDHQIGILWIFTCR
jgi:hypothetical protein